MQEKKFYIDFKKFIKVHAENKQYWTESIDYGGMVEQVMNDGSISTTFNEGHLMVEGQEAFCVDINTAV